MAEQAGGAARDTFRIRPGGQSLEAACWIPDHASGAPILMLHEGLGCIELWRDTPARLAQTTGRAVYAYSRAGYGRSGPCTLPRPVDYMTREAELLPQVLAALDLDEHILIGHSDGASIAAIAAARRPEGLHGMVLIAPHFFVEDVSVRAIRAARQAFHNGDLRDRLARYHDNPDMAFLGWNEAWLDPDFRDWDISDTIPRWNVPVLAVQGTEDPYGTDRQVTVIRDQCAGEVVLLQGCGHAPHLEAAEQWLDLLTGFVSGISEKTAL